MKVAQSCPTLYKPMDYAAAKSLQSCPTLCDPRDGRPPGSPSLGFSRQEHWSGLPVPSPTHESEKWKRSRSVVSDSLRPHRLQPTRLLYPWDFPGKSTGVGCHCLLPPWTIVQAKTLEWVAYPFSRGSSRPRNGPRRPRVSCIAGGFFTNWAIREARVSTGDFKFLFTQDSKSPTKRRKWKSPVLTLDK